MLSATSLYELLKVDVLLEHYAETKKHDGPISFLDFLVMHYITDDGNSKDNDRDEQLPFKSHNNFIASNSFTILLNKAEEPALTPIVADKRDFPGYKNPFITSMYSNTVWNPPRFS